nr:beta-1,4-glucuronyltransferase 1-like [Cherax quadricarinatus]
MLLNHKEVRGGEGGGRWWACGTVSCMVWAPGMVWARAWRRWQRWACVAVAVILGAWLLLAAPCALLACPPQDSEDSPSDATEEPRQHDDPAHLMCTSFTFVPSGQRRVSRSSPQLGESSPYSVVYDWLPAAQTFTLNESVTYTTHTTPEMIAHVAALASRWTGPISVALFVPHSDFCLAAARVAYLRVCGPPAVKERVSWHIFWPRDAPPAADWHLIVKENTIDCNADKTSLVRGYRATEVLPYPVNVARNVARVAAPTWFVLPSDVELYPSHGLVDQFLALVQRINSGKERRVSAASPRVFVVPVFEVAAVVPTDKEELVQQYHQKDAVYFHRHVCAHCQRFPALTDWIRQPGKSGILKVFSVVKRQFPYHRWEPIYICTKDEPLYDERLSWEGLQDKMTQMHELCLRDYNFVILDRAFLVHAPGIKKRNKSKAKMKLGEILLLPRIQ